VAPKAVGDLDGEAGLLQSVPHFGAEDQPERFAVREGIFLGRAPTTS
jgi:hypothetical protein